MKLLEEKILKEGQVFPGNILKVSSFLNHQIDADFLMEMGKEIARLFKNDKVTKVLTVEASGIAIAVAAAAALHVPAVFAKKKKTTNLGSDVYTTKVFSYTHQTEYSIIVEKAYMNSEDNVLLVDDFLASGKALNGLAELVYQAGATVAGASVAIEKCFQHGGDELRSKGIRVESLAMISEMSENSLSFKN